MSDEQINSSVTVLEKKYKTSAFEYDKINTKIDIEKEPPLVTMEDLDPGA